MAINFDEIPNEIEVPLQPAKSTRTVLEEINARQGLLQERAIKCKIIEPLYEKPKKRPQRYTYKYFCVCPRYNPQYPCQHTGNVVVDRDVLTPAEHLVYLATPKENKAAPRKLPRFYQKKFIVPNCTARINKLAAPDIKRVMYTLSHFKHLLPKRHRAALKQHLEKKPKVEYTDISTALEWLEEEKRLRKVARRMEKMRCQKLTRQIAHKQRTQIKKIICVLFEEMKDFLLNDQFIMDESSTLVSVILETLKEFTEKEFYTTSNLRQYQKILAFNLAVWINKFISNLNIHVAETSAHYPKQTQAQTERPMQEMQSFLPIGDYISRSSGSDNIYYDDEGETNQTSQRTFVAVEVGSDVILNQTSQATNASAEVEADLTTNHTSEHTVVAEEVVGQHEHEQTIADSGGPIEQPTAEQNAPSRQ